MFRAAIWVFMTCLLSIAGQSCSGQPPQATTDRGFPPKLVVAITVDQMRADYLTRYLDGFGDDGFQRFFNEGFVGMDHHFSYAPTYTGPGHASIATGTTPAVHGIIGNNFYSRDLGKRTYCVADSTSFTVGMVNQPDDPSGHMSPNNMTASTWSDELKLHFSSRNGPVPKVIGASMKDRGAILPAGHAADAAYWLSNGNFITSSHYMDSLPNWVVEFNKSTIVDDHIDKGWVTLDEKETYQHSLPDNNPYEGTWKGSERPVFPYDLRDFYDLNGGKDIIKGTPAGNTLLVDFGLAAITHEKLGEDSTPDVLALSFSSTDYVGHKFGAHAIETEDTYRRLDRELARLFSSLDKTLGAGQWMAFLTADHGAVTVPGLEKSRGLPVDYWNPEPMKAEVSAALRKRFGREDLVLTYDNDQFFLNRELLLEAGMDVDVVARFIARVAETAPEVQRTLTAQDLRSASFYEGAEANVQRGWNAKASGDVVVMLKPGFLEYSRTGTSHGSPYAYDTHVPFLLIGPGVPKGKRSYARSEIRDIAPTPFGTSRFSTSKWMHRKTHPSPFQRMSQTAPIQHRFNRRGRHELNVHSTFPSGLKEIRIPMWRPGRYEPGNFAQRVRKMEQHIADQWVPLTKSGLHTWTCISTPDNEPLEIRFDYTARRMDAGNTWSDDHLLYVNPVNLAPHHPDWAEHPIEVLLADVPVHWKIATALEQVKTPEGTVLCANGTQHLMDSPWIAAPESDLWHDSYFVDGHQFHIHVWGKRHYEDAAFLEAHERFTAAQMKAFGWLPCPEYHFLYLFPDGPARHGVEHEASTVIAWGPANDLTHDNGQASPGLEEVIDIASHELVHTWNVKWLRPAEWLPYNFDQPSPSRLGYVAEGVTTYLGDLFLLESGVIDMEGWLRRFEKLLTRHLWNPGRLSTSLADSSFDTWLDGYSMGIPHRRGNIYVEGAVLAFLCDVALNRAGGGWLIDALAELAGPDGNRSLNEDDWWTTLARRAGVRGPEGSQEISDLRSAHCEGTDDTWPAIVDALLHQGIQAKLMAHKDPLARSGALCGKGREGRNEVKVCWPNSPAWKAGMRQGDVVSSHKEQGDQLQISWLRDSVHSEENIITSPSGLGHFPRPFLEVLPG